MKNILLLLILLPLLSSAQKSSKPVFLSDSSEVDFFNSNLRMTASERALYCKRTIEVAYAVDTNGRVSEISVSTKEDSLPKELENEVVSIINLFSYKSAYSKGQPVTAFLTQKFTLCESRVYNYVEHMPEYKGGESKMMEFIRDNYKIPVIDKAYNLQGKVIISFVVDEDGTVSDVKIRQSVSYGLDMEATRVVKLLKFKGGIHNGKPVKVNYTLPILIQYQ